MWRWSPAPNRALDEGSLVAGDSHLACSLLGQLGWRGRACWCPLAWRLSRSPGVAEHMAAAALRGCPGASSLPQALSLRSAAPRARCQPGGRAGARVCFAVVGPSISALRGAVDLFTSSAAPHSVLAPASHLGWPQADCHGAAGWLRALGAGGTRAVTVVARRAVGCEPAVSLGALWKSPLFA